MEDSEDTMAYILVIDDDEDFALAAAKVVQKSGHEVHIECTPSRARESVQARRPDLILLDVMFPEDRSAGFKLARDELLRGIPILMLTAVNMTFPLGFNSRDIDDEWLPVAGFLEKPLDIDVLSDKVEKLLADAGNAETGS